MQKHTPPTAGKRIADSIGLAAQFERLVVTRFLNTFSLPDGTECGIYHEKEKTAYLRLNNLAPSVFEEMVSRLKTVGIRYSKVVREHTIFVTLDSETMDKILDFAAKQEFRENHVRNPNVELEADRLLLERCRQVVSEDWSPANAGVNIGIQKKRSASPHL